MFKRGWNGPTVTGTPGLSVFVATDGTETGYFKGRIDGVGTSIKLPGRTIEEWRRACAEVIGQKSERRHAAQSAVFVRELEALIDARIALALEKRVLGRVLSKDEEVALSKTQ